MSTKLQIDAANPADLTAEIAEWLEAFDEVVVAEGPEQGAELLAALRHRARRPASPPPANSTTPYLNTIPKHEEVPYPGDRAHRAPHREPSSAGTPWPWCTARTSTTPASAATSRPIPRWPRCSKSASTTSSTPNTPPKGGDQPGDFIYFQGHASPGVYARSFLEGRFDETRLKNFRHELRDTPGLSSAIRTPGSCRTSGASRPSRWASARSTPSIRRASCAISKTAT